MAGVGYQLYHQDAYLRKMDATVLSVDGARVLLSRTVFYPQGGGPARRPGPPYLARR